MKTKTADISFGVCVCVIFSSLFYIGSDGRWNGAAVMDHNWGYLVPKGVCK